MLIYLDASIFLMWLKQEQDDIQCLKGTEAIIRALDFANSKHHLVMSTITLTEVFEKPEYAKKFPTFEQMVRRYEFQSVTQEIAKLAGKIRQEFRISTPDATHVATALLAKVDYLCSADKHMLKLENKTGFAEFSKKYSGDQFRIIKPPVPGMQSDFEF